MGISEATYARLRNPGHGWQTKTVQVKNRSDNRPTSQDNDCTDCQRVDRS